MFPILTPFRRGHTADVGDSLLYAAVLGGHALCDPETGQLRLTDDARKTLTPPADAVFVPARVTLLPPARC